MLRHNHEGGKAARYISQLDLERCNGQWQLVPELARKIEKHAPNRKCLALTARVEAHIAEWLATDTDTSNTDLAKHIPPLLTAIEDAKSIPEDAFEASVCLAWVHHSLGEPALAISRLPNDIPESLESIPLSARQSRKWIQVCAVKGGYLKGEALEKTAGHAEAARAYSALLPVLPTPGSQMTPQLGLWTNRVLSRLCEVSMIPLRSGGSVDFSAMMGGFRLWTQHWQQSRANFKEDQSHKDVWVAYYKALSEMLRQNILCDANSPELQPSIVRSANDLSPQDYLSSRLKQRAELKSVETANEKLILESTTFPKANERNSDVEMWVEAVVDNWRILCGPSWQDEELGAGGKEAIARGVLDILYRAATKTFHSPQILRHLFTVHSYLTEFDLAMKAFDSYSEIIKRGRERDENSGEEDPSLDGPDAFIWTNAETIKLLCRYGSFEEAERAEKICDEFERWLKSHVLVPIRRLSKGSIQTEHQLDPKVSPEFVSLAHHAIGISRSNWARWTYDVAARAGLQAKAIQSFRNAVDPRFGKPKTIEYLYSLAFQMAEMRDLPNAIKVAKQALAPVHHGETPSVYPQGPSSSMFQRERQLMPLWHLLALALSSRSDYAVAAKACEAAFDQFHDTVVLFGRSEAGMRASTDSEMDLKAATKGIADDMNGFEKEGILQIKMTQIALLETIEGSDVAVESTGELFALYARLFGNPDADTIKPSNGLAPPPSANGTVKGSIFSRKSFRRPKTASPISAPSDSITESRPGTSATQRTRMTQVTMTPTIQVTGDDGTPERRQSMGRKASQAAAVKRSASAKLHKKHPPSREGSVKGRPSTSGASSIFENHKPHEGSDEPLPTDGPHHRESKAGILPAIGHNIAPDQAPAPVGHLDNPPRQDTRLPAQLPGSNGHEPQPRYPQAQEKRYKTALLVQIWLFVAGMYSRAGMYSEAKGATDEAATLVERLEFETVNQNTSARALANRSWSCSKSIDELWGDVWAERGTMAQTQASPFAAQLCYEKALTYWPNHSFAIIGLSELLLDIYDEKIPPEPPENSPDALPQLLAKSLILPTTPKLETSKESTPPLEIPEPAPTSPKELHRLASRDRAYGLLASLTKLGSGWDCSEAWFALARAYEAGGQIGKAKEVLWWCVELEDTRPVRHWRNLGCGGYVR
ncbi:hypothetical protein P152DRAFT_418118 [Eremomyces bilateralis CBS 781.70]|uniref:Filamentation protein-like protein n=1 Tax=Eremomyces bilateralis CBS 781.70 TaxID=1392243 RepID=A0A6G1G1W0_9PEZI|nr:uncharacterized protein P152DRAFT_418118 [Eremomyces bilateralis CBS 781.70]KAF1812097.1 hypothetical protein P152DRAFT_418118 [Eremomyces bilateralis CBS 781.70]